MVDTGIDGANCIQERRGSSYLPVSLSNPSAESDLYDLVRRCDLKDNPGVFPYRDAAVSLEVIEIKELRPLSRYVLADRLEAVRKLQEHLAGNGVDIFDLPHGLVWPFGATASPLAQPVIEIWPNEGTLLVDGLHRVWTAREQGRKEVRCIVIRNVRLPLVPLPVSWEDIKIFPIGTRPTEDEKRVFRFESASALRKEVPSIASMVTDENFRYFLYRNLDALGSSGIRPVESAPQETVGKIETLNEVEN